ncbi:EF Tu GTP-binding domain protein [Rhizoctonia solani 123E]|uniref:Elongation factor 1 alpha-like protein n=1 Tax=Rhizoctonia solani 123E TaxID=1423351 RepID=A0A074S930_9AGAM|nr:EF Tu GTP-binding domain protein [Rhizoctonia solani 123E]
MSRHRDVRNMNIHDELAEDEVSDTHDEDEDMTDEQKDQMATGLAQVHSVLGSNDESGIDDKQIKNALWDSYFDVEGTITWLLDQRAKQAAAAAKKVPDRDESLQAPLSALGRLALQRRQPGSSSATSTSDKPSGLASLAKGLSKKSLNVGTPPVVNQSPVVASTLTSTPTNLPPKISKLSALAQKSASLRASSVAKPSAPQTTTSSGPPPSKLALRIKAQKDAQEAAARPQPEINAHEPESNVPSSGPEFELFGNLRPGNAHPETNPQATFPHELRTGPSLFGNILASKRDTTDMAASLAQIYSGITSGPSSAFKFNTPSPDEMLDLGNDFTPAHKARAPPGLKKVNPNKQPPSNKAAPKITPTQRPSGSKKQPERESTAQNASVLEMDLAGLNLAQAQEQPPEEAPPKVTIARERILEEARKEATSGDVDGRKRLSLVVIGHVDAGKSTLMGRLLYECGQVEEKRRREHERASEKAGKASFSWAWELDAGAEERERGITMDIAQSVLPTEHRIISILDAPGHKDFVPNMISGASQADCALLVVDAATGAFEKGFEGGGQTREHIGVVRSLGVRNIVVAVNKMDMVDYKKSRFDEIQATLITFLVQAGFNTSRIAFVPCAGVSGVNLTKSEEPALQSWWNGKPIVDYLDQLEPPVRDFDTPLRVPISNVFKGVTSSGVGISGRISGGIVQVGEKVRVVPGDETAVIKSIEKDDASVQWAAAGSNVTIYLASIDPIHLSIGSVLSSTSDVVPLASSFNAQIIVFDIQLPIIGGSSVELFHHSREVPASISKLIETVDRATGAVIKRNPRVLPKSSSAKVTISLRAPSGPSARPTSIPLEPFSANKEMGRILLRRGGETIAAGIVTEIFS